MANTYTDRLTDKDAMKFIDQVADPFKSLPHLPEGLVEFFVKIAPWLALLGAILGLVSGPVIGLLGTAGSLLTLSPMLLIGTVVTVILTVVNSIILLMAFGPLKERAMKGWVFLFWSQMLRVVEAVLSIIVWMSVGSLMGTIIGTLIGLYILFEMRPKYGAMKKIAE